MPFSLSARCTTTCTPSDAYKSVIAAGMEVSNASIVRSEINNPLSSRLVANIKPVLLCLNFTCTILVLIATVALQAAARSSWRLSITMEAAFCVETLEETLGRHGKPDIFNTDQGSQFTGQAFTGVLANNKIAISMDGKGAWRDNVFVERLWRSVKYEEVYLRAYDSVSEARASIGRYLDFYNGRRPHSSLDDTTPDQAYFTALPLRMAA